MQLDTIYSSDSGLQCPACNSDFTQHGDVEVWAREEDSDTGAHAHVYARAEVVSVSHSMAGNPSSRRSGLRIAIECEACHEVSHLEIVQHKGVTYLGWART